LGISWILRIGVSLSLLLESYGILLNYLQKGDSSLTLSPTWRVGNENFFAFVYASVGALGFQSTSLSITALGVAVLLLTPYVRVLAAIFYYIVERDWKFVFITLLVFAIINFGLIFL